MLKSMSPTVLSKLETRVTAEFIANLPDNDSGKQALRAYCAQMRKVNENNEKNLF